MRPMETLQNLVNKAYNALIQKGINTACNEQAQTFLVRAEDTERAERVIVNSVVAYGVKIEASKGRAYSTFVLLVPTGTVEELEQFKF